MWKQTHLNSAAAESLLLNTLNEKVYIHVYTPLSLSNPGGSALDRHVGWISQREQCVWAGPQITRRSFDLKSLCAKNMLILLCTKQQLYLFPDSDLLVTNEQGWNKIGNKTGLCLWTHCDAVMT